MKIKYIDPFTDFGFKKIFGEEASKELLIDFLQCLIPEANIVDLTFKPSNMLGAGANDRQAIYDIYCENSHGEKIIVELQKAKQQYFKDRTMFYSSFPIRDQAQAGDWKYELKAVFCIGILDFTFEKDKTQPKEVIHTVQLKNQHNKVFYNKLKYVYLEMPHFNKTIQELETRLDKWLYFIKNIEKFETIPDIFKDAIFEQAIKKAEIANYTYEERDAYEASLKIYRDMYSVIDYAFTQGEIKGREENEALQKITEKNNNLKIAKALKDNGISIEIIANSTGLTIKEIEEL